MDRRLGGPEAKSVELDGEVLELLATERSAGSWQQGDHGDQGQLVKHMDLTDPAFKADSNFFDKAKSVVS